MKHVIESIIIFLAELLGKNAVLTTVPKFAEVKLIWPLLANSPHELSNYITAQLEAADVPCTPPYAGQSPNEWCITAWFSDGMYSFSSFLTGEEEGDGTREYFSVFIEDYSRGMWAMVDVIDVETYDSWVDRLSPEQQERQ